MPNNHTFSSFVVFFQMPPFWLHGVSFKRCLSLMSLSVTLNTCLSLIISLPTYFSILSLLEKMSVIHYVRKRLDVSFRPVIFFSIIVDCYWLDRLVYHPIP